jgi:hypothetical protein
VTRVKGPLDVHRVLLDAGIPHEMIHLPRVVAGAHGLPAALGLPADVCVALTFFRRLGLAVVRSPVSRTRLLAFGAPAGTRPEPPEGGSRTARLRLADPAEVSAVTDYSAALACPVGLPDRVELLLDVSFARHEVVYCTAGDNATALGIRTGDLLAASRGNWSPSASPGGSSLDLTDHTSGESSANDGPLAHSS